LNDPGDPVNQLRVCRDVPVQPVLAGRGIDLESEIVGDFLLTHVEVHGVNHDLNRHAIATRDFFAAVPKLEMERLTYEDESHDFTPLKVTEKKKADMIVGLP
jgi:hypothetical protein